MLIPSRPARQVKPGSGTLLVSLKVQFANSPASPPNWSLIDKVHVPLAVVPENVDEKNVTAPPAVVGAYVPPGMMSAPPPPLFFTRQE